MKKKTRVFFIPNFMKKFVAASAAQGKTIPDTATASGVTAAAKAANTLITSTYNAELSALHEMVSRWVVHITTDQSEHSSPPKCVLLREMTRLCTFFGLDGVMTFILPQILAFLNDRKDTKLRVALFEHLPAVCRAIGRSATEEFVLPCLESGLSDGDEQVVARALHCFGELVELGLLSRSILIGDFSYPSGEGDPDFKRYVVFCLDAASSYDRAS